MTTAAFGGSAGFTASALAGSVLAGSILGASTVGAGDAGAFVACEGAGVSTFGAVSIAGLRATVCELGLCFGLAFALRCGAPGSSWSGARR